MSTAGQSGIYTNEITDALTITADDQIIFVSIMCLTGTCQIQGTLRKFSQAPAPFTLSAGQSFSWPAANPSAPINGLTITPVGGSAAIMAW